MLTARKGRTRAPTQRPITCTSPTSHVRGAERDRTGQAASSGTGTVALSKTPAEGGLYLKEVKPILSLEHRSFPRGSVPLRCRAEAAGVYPSKVVLPPAAATLCTKPARLQAPEIYSLTAQPCAVQHTKAGVQETAKNPSRGDQMLAKKISCSLLKPTQQWWCLNFEYLQTNRQNRDVGGREARA